MAAVAPTVLNRFQNSEYRMAGRLPDAATAKARATRNATLRSRARMPRPMAMAPMTSAEPRATTTSWRSDAWPWRRPLAYRSCATLDDDASVRPATTARIVANATAAMTARKMTPPSSPPKYLSPSTWANWGAAVLPLALAVLTALVVTRAAAPKPSARVNR